MKILALGNVPLKSYLGSGQTRLQYINGLKKRGHLVDAYDYNAIDPCANIQTQKRLQLTFGFLVQAVKNLGNCNYDVVILSGGESWLAAILLSLLPHRPFLLVHFTNGIEPHMYEMEWKHYRPITWRDRLSVLLLKQSFTHVDRIITISPYDREYARLHNYRAEPHVVAVDNGLMPAFLNQKVVFSRKPVIGYCGTWIKRKGSSVMEEDVTRILREFPEATFMLLGVEKTFSLPEHFPSDVHERIKLVPFQNEREALIPFYHDISILILPSIYESFGNVTAEAMSCGCAVITTATGFGASLKNGKEAVILESPVSPLLYEALKELLLNETHRVSIAEQGYSRAQELSWEKSVDACEAVLKEWVLERHG